MQNLIDNFMQQKMYEKPTDLCEIMKNTKSDKSLLLGWHNYTTLYHYLMHELCSKDFNFFELGIKHGYSVWGWIEYFKKANIYAADIDVSQLITAERVKCFHCDQNNPTIIQNMWNNEHLNQCMFDVIIDDGNHAFHSNYNFLVNSIHKLKKGGLFFIEDLLSDNVAEFNKIFSHLQMKYDLEYIGMLNLPLEANKVDNNIVIIRK